MGLKWDQAEEIAEVLAENHPGLNPLGREVHRFAPMGDRSRRI